MPGSAVAGLYGSFFCFLFCFFEKQPDLSRVDKGILRCKSLTTTALYRGSYESWYVTYTIRKFSCVDIIKQKKPFFFPPQTFED